MVLYPLTYYVTRVESFNRFLIEPILYLLAVYGFARIWHVMRIRHRTNENEKVASIFVATQVAAQI
jgi:hypothetical protein